MKTTLEHTLKRVTITLGILCFTAFLFAQAPPPGPGGGQGQGGPPPGGSTGAPIDGGATALLIGAAAYGYKKIRSKSS